MEGEGARILVVDDNAAARRSLVELLSRSGYEVIEAADGFEATQIWHEARADLAILDLFMPGKDGIELMREFRQLSPGIPVIAMSGGWSYQPGLSLLKAAQHLGALLAIEKPYTAAVMLATVRQALQTVD
jgi:CheY-like chemotaxis protein